MHPLRQDFPLFDRHPETVFLDNASTTQKPRYVIDRLRDFLSYDYANIHRGAYDLSERSETVYDASKAKVRDFLNAKSTAEIVYTYNATYAANILSSTLVRNGWLKPGDRILVTAVEHHANIVPWLILKRDFGIEVDFIELDEEYGIDFDDFSRKYGENVRLVASTAVSNVTGVSFDLDRLGSLLRDDTLFVIDASQGFPHSMIDVQALDADFVFFTGHKVMAETGIGVLYGKKEHLKTLVPSIGGGGAINWVRREEFAPAGLPHRFEPGTPNIIGAASLLFALEYVESIGGYPAIQAIEKELVEYAAARIAKLPAGIRHVGPLSTERKVALWSFAFDDTYPHIADIADRFAEKSVCVRAGHHCAEPFMATQGIGGTIRASAYVYNTKEDIDALFDMLESL